MPLVNDYFTSLSSQLSATCLKVQVAGFDHKIHTLHWYSPRAHHSMAVAISRCAPTNSLLDEQENWGHCSPPTNHDSVSLILFTELKYGNLKGCRNLLFLFHAPDHVCSKSGDFMCAYRTLKFQTQQLVLALGMSPVAALPHGFYKLGI